jgi:hypothetical protein
MLMEDGMPTYQASGTGRLGLPNVVALFQKDIASPIQVY